MQPYSPISGTIASVTTAGETVSASFNAPTLSRSSISTGWRWTLTWTRRISERRKWSEAAFTVASFPDKDFKGKVMAIYPKAIVQDNVVYYVTIISAENPEGLLKPEMTATVNISSRRRKT
jgi:multidrug efflux pump subunit AcrA (membrane-fusion protein)